MPVVTRLYGTAGETHYQRSTHGMLEIDGR